MLGELFLSRTGIRATHIPYQGSAPAMTVLLANEVDFTFETAAVALPHIKSCCARWLRPPRTAARSAGHHPDRVGLPGPGPRKGGWAYSHHGA